MILAKPDGTQFIVQAYRERLNLGKRSALVQKLRDLAEQHGQYLLLLPMPQRTVEVVFSKDPGYLMAETVWNFYDKPTHLIFCERLSKDHNQVLLIVIREGEVYLDTQVENEKVKNELLPLTSEQTYRVIVSGDVALSEEETKGFASSFETIRDSIIKQLPVLNTCRLSTLALALKSPVLGSRITPLNLAAATIVFLCIIWGAYFYLKKPETPATLPQPQALNQKDNGYADFYASLNSPTPSEQIEFVAQNFLRLYNLPQGWEAGELHFNNNNYRFNLIRQGGSVEEMQDWAKQHNYAFDLGTDSAALSLTSTLSNRGIPRVIYPLQPVVAFLIDKLDPLFADNAITVGEISEIGKVRTRGLTINLKDVSPEILPLIGNVLGADLPLSISTIDVKVNAGLISGTIQLSAWGI